MKQIEYIKQTAFQNRDVRSIEGEGVTPNNVGTEVKLKEKEVLMTKKIVTGFYIFRRSRINPKTGQREYPKKGKCFKIWVKDSEL